MKRKGQKKTFCLKGGTLKQERELSSVQMTAFRVFGDLGNLSEVRCHELTNPLHCEPTCFNAVCNWPGTAPMSPETNGSMYRK
jgi:hypothetical protein